MQSINDSNLQENLMNAGYDYVMNNTEIPSMDWNEQTNLYFQDGVASATGDLHRQWETYGYEFISNGVAHPDLPEWQNLSSLDRSSLIAAAQDGFQKGIEQALNEGNVVNPNNIPSLETPFENATSGQQNLEMLRTMLNEGHYTTGVESVANFNVLREAPVSSAGDEYFHIRNMPISASELINAGRTFQINQDTISAKEIQRQAERLKSQSERLLTQLKKDIQSCDNISSEIKSEDSSLSLSWGKIKENLNTIYNGYDKTLKVMVDCMFKYASSSLVNEENAQNQIKNEVNILKEIESVIQNIDL